MEPAATFNQDWQKWVELVLFHTVDLYCTHHPFHRPPISHHTCTSLCTNSASVGLYLDSPSSLQADFCWWEHARIIEVILTGDSNRTNIERLFWFILTCKGFKVLFGVVLWIVYSFLGCQMWAPIQQFAWCLKHCWQRQSNPECRMFFRADPTRKILDCSAWKTLAATHWSLLGYLQ